MKKSNSITFPRLVDPGSTVPLKRAWSTYLSLRPLHSKGILSSRKPEKNPTSTAHLQMGTERPEFGGSQLCVNNW